MKRFAKYSIGALIVVWLGWQLIFHVALSDRQKYKIREANADRWHYALCSLGSSSNCFEYGVRTGDPEYYAKACEAGDPRGCRSWANDTLRRIRLSGVEDPSRRQNAITMLKDLCDDGNGVACGDAAHALQPTLDPETQAQIRDLYQNACPWTPPLGGPIFDEQACSRLAMMMSAGEGGPVDGPQAIQFAKLACEERTCFEKSTLVDHSLILFARISLRHGRDAQEQLAGIRALEEKCDQASEPYHEMLYRGCLFAARILSDGPEEHRDNDQIMAFRERACRIDNRGCVGLAWAYAKGEGVTADADVALDYYERACNDDIRNVVAATCLEAANFAIEADDGSNDYAEDASSFGILACAYGGDPVCERLDQRIVLPSQ